MRHRLFLCRQGVALANTRQLRSQGPVSVHAHRIEEVAGPEGWEGANLVGGGIVVGDENGDGSGVGGGNGDVNRDGDGDGTGRRSGVEANEGTQDGNGDGSGGGNESSSGDGNGNEDRSGDGNEDDRVREGGGEAKPHKSCRRDVVNGGDFGGKKKKNVNKKGLVQ